LTLARAIGLGLLATISTAAHAAEPPQQAGAELPYRIQWSVKIPMRDRLTLDATIIRPAGDEPVPVVFTLTPYVADRFVEVGAYFARHGYAFASIDNRGRGNSEGVFIPWSEDGRDGHDAVEWLAAQPWSDGQVAMWGGSYGGKNQWMIAGEVPQGLKTIVPASAGLVGDNIGMNNSNVMRAFDHNWIVMVNDNTSNTNGAGDDLYWHALYREIGKGEVPFRDLDKLSGLPSPIWQQWMEHPFMDAFWDSASTAKDRYPHIKLPTLSIAGQYEASNTGTIDFRQFHLEAKGADVAEGSYLVLGPWDHPGSRNPKRNVGGLDFGPAAEIDVKALHVAWYDHVMKEGPLPPFLADNFVYYLAGTNTWRSAPSVPAATARKEVLWLSSPRTTGESVAERGELVARAARQQPDSYVYDPSLPGRNEGFEGGDLVSANYLTDAGMVQRLDGDGLVYDTAPLPAAADLVGMPKLSLSLAMDVPDTDIRAALYEVKADGSVVFLTQDWVRARHRNSRRSEELVPPGRVETYRFEKFNFIARTLEKGSVVRLAVVPLGAGYHTQRNRNSGKPVADETVADSRVAKVSLSMGPRLSRLELPWGADQR
jgi:uncharacterized protein